MTLPASWDLFHANDTNLCILPCAGGDEGGFVVATLYLVTDPHADHLHKAGNLHLQIFSSESWDWSTKLVVLDPSVPQDEELFYFANDFVANKVMSLGEGLLGWVNLSQCILCCDAFEDNPVLRFIRLPTKMRDSNMNYTSKLSARAARDVTYCHGLIKFVEVETASEFCYNVAPFDSDLQLGNNVPTCHVGWRATTWSRMIPWKYWQKDCIVTDDDISVDNRHADLLAELRDNYSREITLKNLLVGAPKLSISNSDVIYLMSKVSLEDNNALIIAETRQWKTLLPFRWASDRTLAKCLLQFQLKRDFISMQHIIHAHYPNICISPVFLQTSNQYANLHGLTNTTLIVGKLHPSMSKQRLEVFFSMYGEHDHVEIFKHEQYA